MMRRRSLRWRKPECSERSWPQPADICLAAFVMRRHVLERKICPVAAWPPGFLSFLELLFDAATFVARLEVYFPHLPRRYYNVEPVISPRGRSASFPIKGVIPMTHA